jgi:uncharacterized protein (TIGR02646 family)
MIKLHRSTPAPECLEIEKKKANGDYKCGDVIKRLAEDFKNKCYLCESKGPTSSNVEHFIPHKGDKELKFDWENLFLSCAHCNNIKGGTFDNILNCTHPDHDVENWVYYQMKPFPKEPVTISAKENTEIVRNTVQLLDKIYNGSTKQKTYESANLRDLLLMELLDFQSSLLKYFDEKTSNTDVNDHLNNIKWHVSKSSAFTAFKRWIVKDNPRFKKEFMQFFD